MKNIENAILCILKNMQTEDLLVDENGIKDDFLEKMDSITLMTFLMSLEEELNATLFWGGIKKQMTYHEFVEYLYNQKECE